MRTTVTIDDNLLLLAKERAAQQGKTLGDLVETSLHFYLAMPKPVAGPPLPVFEGGTGLAPGIDPASNASLFDAADGCRPARQRMKVLDANVVLALYRPDHPHHASASRWWQGSTGSGEPFTVPDLVWVAFCRLVTNPRVMPVPASFEQAWAFHRAVREQGGYASYAAHPHTLMEFARLCSEVGARANLVTDAYTAAIASTLGASVVTFDRDFRKFDGVRVEELTG